MTTQQQTCYVVFGDLRGWDTRLTLVNNTSPDETLHRPIPGSGTVSGNGFATIRVGDETVYGPIVHETSDPKNHTIIVYAGRRIPEWATQPGLNLHGWAHTDNLPDAIQFAFEEIDTLLLHFGPEGALHGWARTLWLPAVPRPMQRLRVALGDTCGPHLDVRILEVGQDLVVDGGVTPFIIADTDTPPGPAELAANGWVEEHWVAPRRDTWWGLHLLSQAIEAKSATVLGHSMTTEVVIHNPDGLVPSALPLLPKDVQGALRAAAEDGDIDIP